MKLKASKITDAVIAITYMCNARCQMCNIWQYKGPAPLPAEEYLKLPSSLKSVNISGGEAFLRSDMAQVMANIKKAAPRAKFKISTNAFATELMRKRMSEILAVVPKKDIGITISIDGYQETHDRIRGIPGGYQKIIATIEMMKEIGITDLTIATTIGDYNVDELMKMYDESLRLGTQFTVAVVHNSDHYFQIESNRINRVDDIKNAFIELIKRELKTWSPKRWVRAFFAYGIIYYLTFKKRILPTYGGVKAIFLDANGFVFPSDVAARNMGNIKDYKSFQDLMNTEEATKAVERERLSPNWMICTARTAIQSHPIKVITWVFLNKFVPGFLKLPKGE